MCLFLASRVSQLVTHMPSAIESDSWLPKRPKQKNSYPKKWLTGHVYILSCQSWTWSQTKFIIFYCRGAPTSTVSCSTISTCTVFQCYVLKTVLVEFLCTINLTSGNWLCSTHKYEFRIVRFFPNPKNRTKRGPPVFQNFPISLLDFYIRFFLSLTFPISLLDFTI